MHIKVLAGPPWQLDFSSFHLSCNHGVCHGDERKRWSDAVRASTSLPNPNHPSVFARGLKSNWNGNDDLQPATGIAVLFTSSLEASHAARCLGVTTTEFDADLCALVTPIAHIQYHLNLHPAHHVTLCSIPPTQ
jgi:hypothetical protein